MYYTYVLYSKKDGNFYTGFTQLNAVVDSPSSEDLTG